MAKPTLTLEELIASQKALKAQERLSKEQVTVTKEQLSRLASGEDIEDLRKDIKDITSPKKISNKVGLNTLHDDLTKLKQSLEKTAIGTPPKEDRVPLPVTMTPTPTPTPTRETQETPTAADTERTQRLQKIGNVIQQKIGVERGGSLNQSQTKINTTVFDKFVAQSKQRDELLKSASEEQIKIFQELEDTLVELRGSGSKDSEKLRKTLAELEGRLSETKDTEAKGRIGYELATARKNAEPNNLGNVFKALMGKDSILKKGYEREGKNIRNTETGQFASKAEASKGRLASAGTMLGQFIGRKVEEDVEGSRSKRFQGFLDRNFRTTPREEKAAYLGGQLQALRGIPSPTAKVDKPLRYTREISKSPAVAAIAARVNQTPDVKPPSEPNTVNINAKTVNIQGKEQKKPEIVDDSQGESDNSGMLSNMWKKGKGLFSKTVPGAATAGEAAAGTGASASGGILSGVGGKLLGGGALALGGTALQYGGEKLKEHGYEKTGKAVGVAGTAAKYAGVGAMIGTVIPGVGNVVGGAVGGAIGAGKGIYDQYIKKPDSETIVQQVGSDEDIKKAKATAQGVASKTGLNASSLSMENEKAKSTKTTNPIIVNNQAPAPNVTHSTILPRGNLRPQESALERYTSRGAHFL